jgi:hypothetical protein
MLVHQMLMTLFLGISNLRVPSSFLHDFSGPENGFFKAIMTVYAGRILNQMWIIDIPPPITITDPGNIPGGMFDGTGNKLAKLYRFKHRRSPKNAKRATCRDDKPPWMLGYELFG